MFKQFMILATIISGLLTAAAIWLCITFPAAWLESVAITLGTVFYHFAMRMFVGAAWSPFRHRPHPQSRWFCEKSWEARLYKTLRVKSWKRFLPTYDPATFDIKINAPADLLITMCHSERVHETIVVLSFVPLIGTVWFGAFPAFLITSLLSAMFDLSFVILQRYNRPRIAVLMKRERRKQ